MNTKGPSRGQPIKGGPPTWGLGEVITSHREKNSLLRNVTQELAAGLCGYGNEPSRLIEGGEFLEEMNDY
jgi:hypothetical protein